MKKFFLIFAVVAVVSMIFIYVKQPFIQREVKSVKVESVYWMLLKRKSNKEILYKGVAGEAGRSRVVKTFRVKTGIPGERPTPLPALMGRKYWLIIKKEPSDNPETAPYFLTLDIPAPSEPPYGPVPYKECGNKQCDWVMPGEFGLHGVNGDESKLSDGDPGSSGCIRHTDRDITYLYKLFDPGKEKIRYYVEDI